MTRPRYDVFHHQIQCIEEYDEGQHVFFDNCCLPVDASCSYVHSAFFDERPAAETGRESLKWIQTVNEKTAGLLQRLPSRTTPLVAEEFSAGSEKFLSRYESYQDESSSPSDLQSVADALFGRFKLKHEVRKRVHESTYTRPRMLLEPLLSEEEQQSYETDLDLVCKAYGVSKEFSSSRIVTADSDLLWLAYEAESRTKDVFGSSELYFSFVRDETVYSGPLKDIAERFWGLIKDRVRDRNGGNYI